MKGLITFAFILFSIFAVAQERSSIAISYGFGNGELGSIRKSGGASYEGNSMNVFGVSYWNEISKNLFFETGIDLYRYPHTKKFYSPSSVPKNYTMNMISAPFKLRFEAGDYIFFNGGLTVDISKSKSASISGMGAGIGAGVQVKFFKQFSLYVNPQANIHGLLPLRMVFPESHLLFGLSYQISKP